MEDYSKVAVVKRNYAATLEKVRGAIRPTSLLWREACSARSKIKREKKVARTPQKASGKGCRRRTTRAEVKCNCTLPLSEHSNIQ